MVDQHYEQGPRTCGAVNFAIHPLGEDDPEDYSDAPPEGGLVIDEAAITADGILVSLLLWHKDEGRPAAGVLIPWDQLRVAPADTALFPFGPTFSEARGAIAAMRQWLAKLETKLSEMETREGPGRPEFYDTPGYLSSLEQFIELCTYDTPAERTVAMTKATSNGVANGGGRDLTGP